MEETVVKLSLSYYDDLRDKFDPLFRKVVDHRRFIKENDLERNTIEYYDSEGKVIFRSEYEILGVYNKSQKIWAWGWSDPKNKKNEIYISITLDAHWFAGRWLCPDNTRPNRIGAPLLFGCYRRVPLGRVKRRGNSTCNQG